ncbi:MAG: Holliday junction resolvase-like protein [Candidatus Aenigmatarchaeota archaeon]
MSILITIISFLIGFIVSWFIFRIYFFNRLIKFREFIAEKVVKVIIPKSIRAKLIEAISKDIIEQFAPFTEKFKEKNINAIDAVYLGEPIDFIVFDGWKSGEIKRIIFVEVKAGEAAKLTKTENDIKEIVNKKEKIEFEEIDFTKEKLVSEAKIKEVLESSTESIEIKNKIIKEIKEEELKKFI